MHDGATGLNTGIPAERNRWQHIAAVYTADSIWVYKNGNLAFKAETFFSDNTTTSSLVIGRPASGRLDEVRIWDRIRTPGEIVADLDNPLVGNESGLIAYFRFDQTGTSTNLPDRSVNNFFGTKTGGGTTWIASLALMPALADSLYVEETGADELTLTWVDLATGEVGFDIERSTDYGQNYTPLTSVGANVTTYVDPGLAAESGFYYRVKADMGGNLSGYSNPEFGSTITFPGNAYDFDNFDDLIRTDLFLSYADFDTMTWEIWVYNKVVTGSHTIMSADDGGFDWRLYMNAGEYWVYDGAAAVNTGISAELATWQHVSTVFTADSIWVYKNGIREFKALSYFSDNSSNQSLVVGVPAIGIVDEIRIWNRIRTEGELQADLETTLVGNESGLVAYYSFDQDAPSVTLPDRSVNNFNGTKTGGGITWVESTIGQNNALAFDGVDDYVSAGEFMPQSYTKEAWVNIGSSSTRNNFVSSDDITNGHYLYAPDVNSYQLSAGHFIGGTLTSIIDSQPLAFDTWYHVAVTYDAGTQEMILYKNGTSIGNQTVGNHSDPTVLMGAHNFANLLTGNLDEVRIWDDVRSQTEIQNNMLSTLIGNEANLVSYYRFDQGTAGIVNTGITTLSDLTSNGNDGTLTNFDLGAADVNESNWILSGAFDPLDPTDLFTTEVSATQIDLSWSDNALNETGYTIERSDGNNDFTVPDVTFAVAADVTTYSDVSVSAENGYYYRVIANGASGDSNPSNEKFGSTITPPGNALAFDGADDFVDFGDVLDEVFTGVDKSFTMESWIYLTDIGSLGEIILSKSGNSNCGVDERQLAFSIREDGLLRLGYQGSLTLTSQRTIGGSTILNLNEWYHVAATYDGSIDSNDGLDRVKLYVNGIEETTSVLTSTGPLPIEIIDGPAHFAIGSNVSSAGTICGGVDQIFNGEIDEVRIWDGVRSELEIQSNLYTELVGNEVNLQAYYRFDQGSDGIINSGITTLPDRSINQNDGTLTNFDVGAADVANSNWLISDAQKPIVLAATNVSKTGFTANWQVVAGATDILVQVDDDPNFGSPLIDDLSVATGGIAVVTQTLGPGLYYYRIKADIGGTITSYSLSSQFIAEPGNGLDFDGVDDVVIIPSTPSINFGDVDFSVEFWISTTASSDGRIITKHECGVGPGWFVTNTLTGIVNFFVNGSTLSSTSIINDGQWHHVAVTFQGSSNTQTIYIDGAFDTSKIGNNGVANTEPLGIGAWANALCGGPGTEPIDGTIDEVRIWNDLRTPTEIQNNLYNELVGNETGLAAYYNFNQGVSEADNTSPAINVLPDLTSNGNDGTLTNMALIGSTSNWLESGAFTPLTPTDLFTTEVSPTQIDLSWTDNALNETGYTVERSDGNNDFTSPDATFAQAVDATSFSDTPLTAENGYYYRVIANGSSGDSSPSNEKFGSTITPPGNGLAFDGVDDYVDLGNDPEIELNTTAYTFETWIRWESFKSDVDIIIGQDDGPFVQEKWIFSYNTNYSGLIQSFGLHFNGANTRWFASNTQALETGKWYHVSFTIDNNDLNFYLNGVNIGNATIDVPAPTPSIDVQLGQVEAFYSNIALDETRIWNGLRSQVEIQNNLFSTLVGNELGLAAYYRFDQGIAGLVNSGIINLPDRSQNQNDGVLTNFDLGSADVSNSNWLISNAQRPIVLAATNVSKTGFTANWQVLAGATDILIQVDDDPNFGSPLVNDLSIPTGGTAAITQTLGPGLYYYRMKADIGGSITNYSLSSSFFSPPGNALDFDGTNDVVDMGDVTNFDGLTAITVEGWINPKSYPSAGRILGVVNKSQINGPGTSTFHSYFNGSNGGFHCSVGVSGTSHGTVINASDNIPLNEWTHYAFTWSTGDVLRIYINGQLIREETTPISGSLDNVVFPFRIGRSSSSIDDRFDGQIDEVRIWSIAKSVTEIQTDILNELTGSEPNLLVYYNFNQGVPAGNNVIVTTLNDMSVSSIDGTLSNFGLTSATSNWVTSGALELLPADPTDLFTTEVSSTQIDLSWTDNAFSETGYTIERSDGNNDFSVPDMTFVAAVDATSFSDVSVTAGNGYYYRVIANGSSGDSNPSNEKFGSTITPPGNALAFDGAADFVDLGDPSEVDFGSGDFTFELWFKPNSLADGAKDFLTKGGGGTQQFGFQFDRNSTGNVKNLTIFFVRDNATFMGLDSDANVITDMNWHHVVGLRRGNSLELHLDGVLIKSGFSFGTVGGAMAATSENLNIGGITQSVNGEIDEVRIWSEARTQVQIQNNMFTTLVGNEPNLVAYYRFDQGIANGDNTTPAINLLPDRSQNQIDGTLNGFTLNGTTSNWVDSKAMIVPFITTWTTTDGTITIPTSGGGYNYDIVWANLTNTGVGDGSTTGEIGDHTITGLENGSTYQVEISGDFPSIRFANVGDKDKIFTIEQWGDMAWTSMNGAFSGCSNLTYNAVDSPDLSGVTDLTRMFWVATSFNGDLSGWDVSNITDMWGMFGWASAFNQDLSGWDVSKVLDMNSMFLRATDFNNGGQPLAWGAKTGAVTDMNSMFFRASTFNQNVSGWDVSKVDDMIQMFAQASAFNQDLSSWDVSAVTNMSFMFFGATSFNNGNQPLTWGAKTGTVTTMNSMFSASTFNQDVSGWDVSQVLDMSNMFSSVTGFNNGGQPLTWGAKTGAVTNMSSMFKLASVFNQDISNWDVNMVTDMNAMFSDATSFNNGGQSLTWGAKTGAVTDMSSMFFQASVFNQDISGWDVSMVTDMSSMFSGSASFTSFNNGGQPLTWGAKTGAVTNMSSMFSGANVFDQDLSSWDVSIVANMSSMFGSAASFNNGGQPLTWDARTGAVTDMSSIFSLASSFDQDMSNWDVSAVTNMSNMFSSATGFNNGGQPLTWGIKTGAVTTMSFMFFGASAFDQNLGGWDVSMVTDMSNMLGPSALSVANYDATLIGWDALPTVQSGVALGASGLDYCSGETARQNLINTHGWTITGDALNCPLVGGVIQSDYDALVALYNSTNGAAWTDNTNWLSANPVSTWYGVTVVGDRVNNILIESNNMTGSLPPEIGDLTALYELDLEDNLIGGEIPVEIGQMLGLYELDLDINQLTGSIPIELTTLPGLSDITLTNNQLTGEIPSGLGSMTNLWSLRLSDNFLTGTIPTELGNLSNLITLRITNCQLTGSIPVELGDLTLLEDFGLQDNQLTGSIPNELGNLNQLKDLQVHSNQLSGSIPTELGNLAQLVTLSLKDNLFSGSIPVELGNLSLLQELEIQRNDFTGTIPSELGNLTNLIWLDAGENQLSGSVPSTLGNLSLLTYLDFSSNQLDGGIPVELGNLTALNELYFWDNQFTGQIPDQLGDLVLLTATDFGLNQFSGPLPSTFTNLTSLTYLGLAGNQLTDLPDLSGIATLTALEVLDNQLEFDDLESNITVATFLYSPQAQIGSPATQNLTEGDPLSLTIPVGGSSNLYQWVKNGTDITGETADNLSIASVSPADIGTYYLSITSPLVPGLTLRSDDIIVTVAFPEVAVFLGSDNTGTPLIDAQTGVVDFGNVLEGNDITQTFAIENTGTNALTITSIISSATEYNVSGAPSTVAVGATETFVLTLDGTSAGVFPTTITINNDDADENPFTFPVTGQITATEPEIAVFQGIDNTGTSITDAQIGVVDFGNVQEGNDITQTFAIENTGTSTLNIASIVSSAIEYSISGAPATVSVGATETFAITLDGTTAGVFPTTITINNDDTDENPFTFPVTGQITATAPEIAVFQGIDNTGSAITDALATGIRFGEVLQGNDISLTFAIENTGTSDLTISSITLGGTDFSVLSSITTIASGSTETFTVTLSGTNVGLFNDVVTIASDDADENPFTFPVTGEILVTVPEIAVYQGVDNLGIEITSSQVGAIDFGTTEQGTDIILPFTIENLGTSSLDISSITSSAPEFTISGAPTAVGAGNSVTFSIILDASLGGTFTSMMAILNSDLDEASFLFNITGIVSAGEIEVYIGEDISGEIIESNSTLDIGKTFIGTPIERSFTIENPSTSETLIISDVSIDDQAFSITQMPTTISPSASDLFEITFAPSQRGNFEALLTISSNFATFTFDLLASVDKIDKDIHVFNIVTPNGDGRHDYLQIAKIDEHPDNRVAIFDRNGKRVYQADNYNNESVRFEGNNTEGDGEPLPSGTYFYVVDLGGGKKRSGFLQLSVVQ